MASLVLSGDTSGSITLAAPAVAGSTTQTLVANTGTLAPILNGTAVASTSGTSIDFTGIPSWVKRITVMFSSVSTNGANNLLIQIGDSGGIETSGYVSGAINQVAISTSNVGFIATHNNSSGAIQSGAITLSLLNSSTNNWVSSGNMHDASVGAQVSCSAGTKSLSDTLTQLRIIGSTTGSPTDTFDAGTINILYE